MVHLARRCRILGAIALLLVALSRRDSAAENVSSLGTAPDWSALEKYQETITREEFERVWRNVYCTRGGSEAFLQMEPETARLLVNQEVQTWFALRFAKDEASRKPVPRSWRSAESLPR